MTKKKNIWNEQDKKARQLERLPSRQLIHSNISYYFCCCLGMCRLPLINYIFGFSKSDTFLWIFVSNADFIQMKNENKKTFWILTNNKQFLEYLFSIKPPGCMWNRTAKLILDFILHFTVFRTLINHFACGHQLCRNIKPTILCRNDN